LKFGRYRYSFRFMLTSAQRSKATSAARSAQRASPRRAFVDVVNAIFGEVVGGRVKGSIERADPAAQRAWFEVAAITASVRVELLQQGHLRGLVDELRALLVGQ
jgi:hypothetical protein